MSVDVYLLPLQPDEDYETAMELLLGLENRSIEVEADFDIRPISELVTRLEPRYQILKLNYAAVARYVNDLKGDLNDYYLKLQGESDAGLPLSDFTFHRTHVVIHEYAGTTSDQMGQFIDAVCRAMGLAAVYPAFGEVHRVGDEGWET